MPNSYTLHRYRPPLRTKSQNSEPNHSHSVGNRNPNHITEKDTDIFFISQSRYGKLRVNGAWSQMKFFSLLFFRATREKGLGFWGIVDAHVEHSNYRGPLIQLICSFSCRDLQIFFWGLLFQDADRVGYHWLDFSTFRSSMFCSTNLLQSERVSLLASCPYFKNIT